MRKEQHLVTRGAVNISLVDRVTGRKFPVASHHNVLTYDSADLMARLTGGDITYAPTGIAFVYGVNGAGIAHADRGNGYAELATEIGNATCNAVYCPLNSPRYLSSGTDYEGNTAVMSAMSDITADFGADIKQEVYLFRGGAYLAAAPTPAVDKYWRVMLLNRRYTGGAARPVYTLFAYTTVGALPADSVTVSADLSLHVEWPITYI